MPEHTLRCNRCDEQFERFSWSELDENARACPRCGSPEVTTLWVIEMVWENLGSFACG